MAMVFVLPVTSKLRLRCSVKRSGTLPSITDSEPPRGGNAGSGDRNAAKRIVRTQEDREVSIVPCHELCAGVPEVFGGRLGVRPAEKGCNRNGIHLSVQVAYDEVGGG